MFQYSHNIIDSEVHAYAIRRSLGSKKTNNQPGPKEELHGGDGGTQKTGSPQGVAPNK